MCSPATPLTTLDNQIDHFSDDTVHSNAQAHAQGFAMARSCSGSPSDVVKTDDPTISTTRSNVERWEPAPEARKVRLECEGALNAGTSFSRKLILLPHPGDEIACAGLLQHSPDPVVVFATDGLTEMECSCPTPRRQQALRNARRRDATTALILAGVRQVKFLGKYDHGPHDLGLYRAVGDIFEELARVVARYHPRSIVVPAYEGGHPDHDACSFVGALLRKVLNVNVWEMPLYHKSDSGELVYGRFREMNGAELIYTLGPETQCRRMAMVACYSSRRDFEDWDADETECYRPQADYDYSRPPQGGALNYENQRWPVSPWELCRELSAYRREMLFARTIPDMRRASGPAISQ